MRIVIVGAGEVGKHLSKMLSSEGQNIVLMDSDPKKLSELSHSVEVMTLEGNPRLIDDLERARVKGADLFVAVTPDEATNILSCALAKKIGALHTLARINNPDYLAAEYVDIFGEMGVDRMIYPEELAAREIASTTLNPWARQYVELFNGALTLVGIKVRQGAPILDRPLSELGGEQGHKFYHVVAIKRDLETIIPTGSTRIKHNDLVFFTCTTGHLQELRILTGKPNPLVRKMVIMGASRVATQTIRKLPESLRICLIERDKEKCMRLSEILPSNVEIYHGDGRDPELLDEVGLDDAEVFVALTENSETNILACLAAMRFGVYKTIAKEENIDYIPLAYRLDIGTLINKKILAIGHIYRILLGMETGSVISLSLVNNAEVAEFVVKRGSKIDQQRMSQLRLPGNMTFGGMVRNGVPQMIDGDTVFEPYDHIVIFYHNIPIGELQALFH
ncbi:Trk system potassium transporter TrkA [Porphyromonas sp. COT-239 OH1446]|uniref:Trk system potassium transporter TrkA n=1 Tax=Porphyromonas sp. COT-239 OH1446 TaxID=1515613 RepID=UPI00052D0AC9|nr:Trk system potassium transporter TrkA [Porphyromonas sp. COT-239 OH1446]KGN71281.1 potassium transporter TrkA [Porphyromonas sp. COT-239 OH1446]